MANRTNIRHIMRMERLDPIQRQPEMNSTTGCLKTIDSALRPVFITLLLWAFVGIGCTGHLLPRKDTSGPIQAQNLVIVTVAPQDTLESLARTYLGSSDKAWWIADYNQIQKAVAGQRLVIPTKPIVYGGLERNGYQTVPVLLYPKITTGNAGSREITILAFEGQMQFLKENGYRTITLNQLDDFFSFEDQLPPKAVVITFDSTERWLYDVAYPILKRNGLTAAVFVSVGQVGKPKHLDWKELLDMAADGFDIGTNGITGQNLTTTASDADPETCLKALEEEILQPRKIMAEHLKRPCRYFAYPDGATDDLIIAMLKKHGYKLAFTRRRGSNPFFVNDYKVRRCVIGNSGGAMQFRQNLTTFISTELQ